MADWYLLAPDEDARDLADSARAQFTALRGPELARSAIDGNAEPSSTWSALVAGGFPDIGVPEDLGGLGRLIDLVVVLEEAGRTLLTAPLLVSAIAYQAQLAAGLHDTTYRSGPSGFALAQGTVAQGRVSVDRAHVLGAPGAATLTLLVTGDNLAWVVVVDPAAAGFLAGATVMDPSRPVAAARFTAAPVLACHEVPLATVPRVLAGVRICVAADLVGVAAGALDAAVAHVRQRSQFGAVLGAFQAIKHQLADAYAAVERARSLAYGAALSGAGQDALLANATAVETAVSVAWRYTQLLGAMGVTFESDSHLYLRRAHQSAALFGSPDDLFLAAAVLARAA
jgi:alkylation response protein AidB-like acyl-CoA dehydrogenase